MPCAKAANWIRSFNACGWSEGNKELKRNETAIISKKFSTTLLILLLLPITAGAGWLGDTFIDPTDGQFDVSRWLAEKKGVLPVPIIITEPAVGYGGGAALLYFHGKPGGGATEGNPFDPPPANSKGRQSPPSISGLAGAVTENDTWLGAGFHFGVWKQDRIRYIGALARTSLNMKFYGLDSGSGILGDRPVEFNLEGNLLYQEVKFRLWASDVMLGAQYIFLDTENEFKLDQILPGLPAVSFSSRSAGLGLVLSYENIDNIFTPNRGLTAEARAVNYDEAWGGDDSFNRFSANLKWYHDLLDNLILGIRLDGAAVSDGAPYYQYPFIEMRGIRAMRYQGEKTILGEAEVRWGFTPRWSLVGFGGVGRAINDNARFNSQETVYTKGAGLRYFLSRRFGLHSGFDVAWGPEETAFYITFGSAWAK